MKINEYAPESSGKLQNNGILTGKCDLSAGKASYYRLPRVNPMRGRKIRHSTTFALGLLLGAFIALLLNIIGATAVIKLTIEARYVGIRLFRGFFIVFLHIIFTGINIYGWRRAGVNHVLVFQVNPRDNLNYQSLMTVGMGLLVLWAAAAIGFIYAPLFGTSQIQFPALLGTVVFIYTFIPMGQPSIMILSSRLWLLRYLARCITAPFHRVRFADFWLADQMTSLAVALLDFSYFICFFTLDAKHWPLPLAAHGNEERANRTMEHGFFERAVCHRNPYGIEYLIILLPFWIRFVQCLRRCFDTKETSLHLTNAVKYATAFFVIGTAVMARKNADELSHAIHVATLFVATGYRLAWDILMDWGLLDCNSHDSNGLLREKLLFRRSSYYVAMLLNTVLRFVWLLPLLGQKPWAISPIDAQLMLCISGVVECFRRFVWNFFRVENEHVNNCGHFRTQRDISIRPLVPSDFGRKKWSSVDVIAPMNLHTAFGKVCYTFDEADDCSLSTERS